MIFELGIKMNPPDHNARWLCPPGLFLTDRGSTRASGIEAVGDPGQTGNFTGSGALVQHAFFGCLVNGGLGGFESQGGRFSRIFSHCLMDRFGN